MTFTGEEYLNLPEVEVQHAHALPLQGTITHKPSIGLAPCDDILPFVSPWSDNAQYVPPVEQPSEPTGRSGRWTLGMYRSDNAGTDNCLYVLSQRNHFLRRISSRHALLQQRGATILPQSN